MWLPLTWAILAEGYLTFTNHLRTGDVIWLGLALSYFLLCRVSELFAYANGLVHPEFCLMLDCPTFFCGEVQVRFLASKNDQNRQGCATTRMPCGGEGTGAGGAPIRAFEAPVELLDAFPSLPGGAPLTTRHTTSGWKVVTRTEDALALRTIVASTI